MYLKLIKHATVKQYLVFTIRKHLEGFQGRDFVNNWVKVKYGADGQVKTAFFADGKYLG